MLYIRCSAPLGKGRSPKSGASKGRRKSSSTPLPAQPSTTPATKQGRQEPKQQQPVQRNEYHKIASSWNVPRTPLRYYPEEQQQIIVEGRGRSKVNAAKAPRPPPPPPPESHLQASCAKVIEVLNYESGMGCVDFTGRNGEKFSQWMTHSLNILRNGLSTAGHPSLAEKCAGLEQSIAGYDRLVEGSAQRAAVVEHILAEITRVGHDLLIHPHRLRSDRYISTVEKAVVRPVVDVDAAAAEAHAEETAVEATTSTVSGEKVIEGTPGQVEDGYVMVGNKKVKAQTVAFRQSFVRAAVQNAESHSIGEITTSGEQRTSEWLALRERRLTASAFSKALGFFPGDRESLWEEKVGLRAGFGGNEATAWGTRMEPHALSTFEELTGQRVESCMFRVKHDDPPHGWLGASPDGLIQGLSIRGSNSHRAPTTPPSQQLSYPPTLSTAPTTVLGPGPGILEIKCPFNKGRPELAVPPARAIWYYMPQMQGLMDIFDRQWCSLYIWTQSHGSAAFQVERDREYWAAAFEVLAEFWWLHVVPARQAHDAGASREEIEAYRPSDRHPAAERLRQWSKRLAERAPGTFYSGAMALLPPQQQQHGSHWRGR